MLSGRNLFPLTHLHNLTRHTPHRKEYTMLWDTHMHTAFSTDSETSPESMIKASIELGLGGICITDHMDYDYPKDIRRMNRNLS